MDFHAGHPGRLCTFTLSTSRSGGDIPSPVATLESCVHAAVAWTSGRGSPSDGEELV